MGKRDVRNEFERTATRVSFVCMAGNVFLTFVKLFSGLAGHSGAMISDAVNSASDVFGVIIVLVGVHIASRPSDSDHPYGHERFECIAAFILGCVLLAAGLGIGSRALNSIISGTYRSIERPGSIALCGAILSILIKEIMYRYTMREGIRIDSAALKAEAYDHRSDVLSSAGALAGITGAVFGLPVLEPVASSFICVLIILSSLSVFSEACEKVTDHSCSDEVQDAMRECAMQCCGVRGIDLLSTREFANRVYVDVEIRADASSPLSEAHKVAEAVHDALEGTFPEIKHVMVHVNPDI